MTPFSQSLYYHFCVKGHWLFKADGDRLTAWPSGPWRRKVDDLVAVQDQWITQSLRPFQMEGPASKLVTKDGARQPLLPITVMELNGSTWQ